MKGSSKNSSTPLPLAPDAAPRVWTVAETLVVDTASATAKRSQMTLADGVVYKLRVSGTITNVIDAHQGDADYYDFSNPKDLGCCEDLGLGIDDMVVNDKNTKPDWGPYNASHVYEVEWTGTGNPIAALFQDTYYGNNQGSLSASSALAVRGSAASAGRWHARSRGVLEILELR